MKLSEAIQHCEEQADLLEESAAGCDMTDKVEKEIACRSGKCAAEHRQLAEWLRKLQEIKEIYDNWNVDFGVDDHRALFEIGRVLFEIGAVLNGHND